MTGSINPSAGLSWTHVFCRIICLLGVAGVGLALGFGLPPPTRPAIETGPAAPPAIRSGDWPTFRGNPLQTGVAAGPLPDKLTILWQFQTKEAVESTAAIVAGIVYVASHDEHLYALDLGTGKEKWRSKVGPVKSPVSCRDGKVYVGNLDGDFHCVAADTGKILWTFKTDGEISSGSNLTADSILFGAGDEHLYCLTLDGKLRWKYQVPGGPVLGTPVAAGDRTFAAGCDSNFHVINLATGKQLARLELGGQVGAAAAVVGDRLYVGTMSSNEVLAIDVKKAEIVWQFQSPRVPNAFASSPAVTSNLVVIGSKDRRVWAIDRRKGIDVWSFVTDRHVNSSPVIAGQRVYAGSMDGNLYVLDLAMGTLLQKIDLGPISASPAVADGRLVIGTEKGVVYCLGSR
jgi:outer membrane protein assembly factor BamB